MHRIGACHQREGQKTFVPRSASIVLDDQTGASVPHHLIDDLIDLSARTDTRWVYRQLMIGALRAVPTAIIMAITLWALHGR
jgi:hypothetical protein